MTGSVKALLRARSLFHFRPCGALMGLRADPRAFDYFEKIWSNSPPPVKALQRVIFSTL